MKRKNLLLTFVLACLALPFYSLGAYTDTITTVRNGRYAANGIATFNRPLIESLLYNPAVHKKQLERDVVQAIGYQPGGQAHFIVHFRKEALHGEWQSFYSNNQPCDSGRFERNLPTGEWKTWYPSGQLKTVRNYNAEKYHLARLDVQRNHPKDQRFALTRLAGKNPARYFQPQFESHMTEPVPMLQRIKHNTSDEEAEYLPPYINCLHHGLFINYNKDGSLKDSGHYVNGVQHGLWKESVNDGTMYAFGFYRHGVRHGQWKYYDGNGRLVYTERYNQNGKRIEQHHFNNKKADVSI